MSGERICASVWIAVLLTTGVWAEDPVELGNTAFREGRFVEATGHYQRALSKEPVFGVYTNLGHAYAKLERWSEAVSSYQKAIALDPNAVTADIWLFLGQARYQANQGEAALDAFLSAASSGAEEQAGVWIARCLIDREQWVRARAALSRHLARNPRDQEAMELLAYVLGQMNDSQGAIDVYRELATDAPRETRYRIALANALAIAGQNRQAIDALELAWRIDRSATRQASRLLADLYLAERMPHEAALSYARAIRVMDRPSADDYFRLSVAYFQSGEFASAQASLRAMQSVDPADSRADLYLGHCAIEEDDPNRAEAYYESAVQKFPTSTEALIALAQLEMKGKRFEATAAHLARALQSGDRRVQVHYNHILALLRMRQAGEQIEAAIVAALARHPDDSQLRQLLDRYISQLAPPR